MKRDVPGSIASLDALIGLAFPRACATCGGEVHDGESTLCWECQRAVQTIARPFCEWCGQPVSGDINVGYTCQQCDQFSPAFDLARSYARFDGPVRSAVLRLKYQNAVWLVPSMVDWLVALAGVHALHEFDPVDLIVPVPLHKKRFRERGFNQAAVLGKPLAKRLDIPFHGKAIRRVRMTPTQTRLTKSARRANVKGAFEVPKPEAVKGKRIMIIDDVMTSGATVGECARVLKKAGAKHVVVMTVAHG